MTHDEPSTPTLSIPDIRDFDRINAELVALLDQGHRTIVLAGAERQRLLASRLVGPWSATIRIEGDCGPEVAAGNDAPGLTIVCQGNVDDGAGARLKAGRLVVLGNAGDALGITQAGGEIVVKGNAGHRAGLRQSGGLLVILGNVGRLASERRTGGVFLAWTHRLGPHANRGASGGEMGGIDPFAFIGRCESDARFDAFGRETDVWIDWARQFESESE